MCAKRIVQGFGLVTAVLCMSQSVVGHHAYTSEYDPNRPVKVQGALVRVELVSPHGWIHLDVKGPDGQVERWMFETVAVRGLAAQGFTKDSVKIGTEMVITGFLSRAVPRRATGQTVTYPDGRQVIVGPLLNRSPEK